MLKDRKLASYLPSNRDPNHPLFKFGFTTVCVILLVTGTTLKRRRSQWWWRCVWVSNPNPLNRLIPLNLSLSLFTGTNDRRAVPPPPPCPPSSHIAANLRHHWCQCLAWTSFLLIRSISPLSLSWRGVNQGRQVWHRSPPSQPPPARPPFLPLLPLSLVVVYRGFGAGSSRAPPWSCVSGSRKGASAPLICFLFFLFCCFG